MIYQVLVDKTNKEINMLESLRVVGPDVHGRFSHIRQMAPL